MSHTKEHILNINQRKDIRVTLVAQRNGTQMKEVKIIEKVLEASYHLFLHDFVYIKY